MHEFPLLFSLFLLIRNAKRPTYLPVRPSRGYNIKHENHDQIFQASTILGDEPNGRRIQHIGRPLQAQAMVHSRRTRCFQGQLYQ